jgi:hypothetical protein
MEGGIELFLLGFQLQQRGNYIEKPPSENFTIQNQQDLSPEAPADQKPTYLRIPRTSTKQLEFTGSLNTDKYRGGFFIFFKTVQ